MDASKSYLPLNNSNAHDKEHKLSNGINVVQYTGPVQISRYQLSNA